MTFTASIEETGVSRNIAKKSAQYCNTKINDRSVLATIKDKRNTITGVDVTSLARSVRSCMRVHPSNTHKIEETLTKLIKRNIIVHRDAVARIATPQERDAAAMNTQKGERLRKPTKTMTRRRMLPRWALSA